MKILVAPDSFKGSISAVEAAIAMEKGIYEVFPQATVYKMPIADGGEGTVAAMIAATSGHCKTTTVTGPLGTPVEAQWGILGNESTAVIEMAAASGLTLVPSEKRNPCITTTYGTGELIKAALDEGIRKIIIGIGGSATNDGGTGMLKALGGIFHDKHGCELPLGGLALENLATLDLSQLDTRLEKTTIMVACDVDNPLCGPRGASAIFGPQKGATPEMIKQLDNALGNYAHLIKQTIDVDITDIPGSGAAGGLGGGLMLLKNATLQPGIELILTATNFASVVSNCQLVITGEGHTDIQTTFGKAPVGVAKIAKQYGVQTICLSGGLGDDYQAVEQYGIDGLMSIVPKPMPLDICMQQASSLLHKATARMCKIIQVGMKIQHRL